METGTGDVQLMQSESFSYSNNHEYFMVLCMLASQRSKDPVTQVGACVVDKKNKVLGLGYNGMPTGCHDDHFPWGKGSDSELRNKYFYVCHAELNAIANSQGDLYDSIIYVTLFPCNDCAKLIIQKGIKEVIFLSDKYAHKNSTVASKLMFNQVGIKYWQFKSDKKFIIEFEDPEDDTKDELEKAVCDLKL